MSAPRTLLVVTSDPDGPVVRHRVLAFRDALAAADVVVEVAPWGKGWGSRRRAVARAASADGVLVSSRLLAVRDVGRLRRRARRLLFDFDDAVPLRDSTRGATPSRTRRRRFRAILAAADAVSAGNPYLAGLAAEVGVAASVLPTVVVVPPGPPSPEPAGPARVVGWIGSRSTLPYLRRLTISLAAVVASGVPVRLRVVADAAPVMPPGLPVDHVPWTLAGETLAIDGMHVGVAPLPDDAWTRGKCGLKVVQMLARGRPVVASPVGVQADQVRDGVTGFLAPTDADVVRALRALLLDPALRARMGAAAREDARARWSVAAWSDRVVAHVVGALA